MGPPDTCPAWNVPQEPATCPQWLIKRLLAKQGPATRAAIIDTHGDGAELAAWVARQPEGKRNDSLNWAACRALDRYGDNADILGRLADAAKQAGLTELEAKRTIRSARAYKGYGNG
jgi:hypothetical protein